MTKEKTAETLKKMAQLLAEAQRLALTLPPPIHRTPSAIIASHQLNEARERYEALYVNEYVDAFGRLPGED